MAERQEAALSRQDTNGDSTRVLVIDDDAALRRMLNLCLSTAGMHVVTADGGQAGLDRLHDDHFDVVVLDLQMPYMDGRAFYREMTSRGHKEPVIILSAYGAEEARRELGAAAAVHKPFDPDDLVETVLNLA